MGSPADLAAVRRPPESVPPGAVWLGFAGQHGFLMQFGATRIGVDLFLTDIPERLYPAPLAVDDLVGLPLVCATHEHLDHLDGPLWRELARRSPATRFAAPAVAFDRLGPRLGVPADRWIPLDDGLTAEVGGVRVHGVPAAHETIETDDRGRHRWLGLVLEAGGAAVYHAGDTCPYPGQAERLAAWRLTAALLPVNGRDAERRARHILGNMDGGEAARLAAALDPAWVVPAHFDGIAGNTADPAEFTAAAAALGVRAPIWVPTPGEARTLRA